MKLEFKLFVLLSCQVIFVAGECKKSDLKKPTSKAHFERWDCEPSTDSEYVSIVSWVSIWLDLEPILSVVPDGSKCGLVCKDGYMAFNLGLRKHHECEQGAWKNQDSIDMMCQLNSELNNIS